MFLDTISGLNKIFDTDIPDGMVILVIGGPGTLKSAFVYNLLSLYLTGHKKEFGSYVTLEETKTSHIRNMQSLKIKMQKRLKVADLAAFRSHIGFDDIDYLSLIKSRALKKAKFSKKKQDDKLFEYDSSGQKESTKGEVEKQEKFKSPTCFALDSLNALYSLMRLNRDDLRQEMLKFFALLKENKMNSFILLETGQEEIYRDEFFLVDGIIELGIMQSQGVLKRYLMVKKMRATKHKLEPYVIDLTNDGIKIIGQLQP